MVNTTMKLHVPLNACYFLGDAVLDIKFWQEKEFFCCPKPSRPVLGNTQLPIQGVLGSFPEINLTNHLYLMPRFKNGRSCTFSPPIHLHVLDRNNCTLLCFILTGVRVGAVRRGTALQSESLRVRFPMESLEFFIYIILPAALRLWGRLSL